MASGEAFIGGISVQRDRQKALRGVGAIFEEPAFHDYLSGWNNLRILTDYSARLPDDELREAVRFTGLESRIHDPVRVYSHGMRQRLALAQALSAKQAAGSMVFVESLALESAKTKAAAQMLKTLGCAAGTILVLDAPDAVLARASRNLPGVDIMLAGDLNAYCVLRARRMVVTRPALEKLQARGAALPAMKGN